MVACKRKDPLSSKEIGFICQLFSDNVDYVETQEKLQRGRTPIMIKVEVAIDYVDLRLNYDRISLGARMPKWGSHFAGTFFCYLGHYLTWMKYYKPTAA